MTLKPNHDQVDFVNTLIGHDRDGAGRGLALTDVGDGPVRPTLAVVGDVVEAGDQTMSEFLLSRLDFTDHPPRGLLDEAHPAVVFPNMTLPGDAVGGARSERHVDPGIGSIADTGGTIALQEKRVAPGGDGELARKGAPGAIDGNQSITWPAKRMALMEDHIVGARRGGNARLRWRGACRKDQHDRQQPERQNALRPPQAASDRSARGVLPNICR
jgi:hypothetical protein